MTVIAPAPGPATAPARARRATRTAVFAIVAGAAVIVVAAIHVTQGTSTVDAWDLLALLTGGGENGGGGNEDAARVLLASRLPRLLAGLAVGIALGIAGALLQSVARNPLASPDTLAVNDGAYLAVVAAAAFGFALPALPAGAIAFLGGLLATALVLALSAGGRSSPTRLVLAGSAVALALSSVSTVLLLLFEEATIGLFAWGSGSLVQSDLSTVTNLAPVIAVAVLGALLLARRLDILALGDDPARVLGLDVRRTRLSATLLAVLLSAAAVTLVGPIGFVGLCAPVLVRLLGLHRHHALIPFSAASGVLIVLGADVALRAVLGGQSGVDIPTGVITTIVGAAVLIQLARRYRDTPTDPGRDAAPGVPRTRRYFVVVLVVCIAAAVSAIALGMLAGDTWMLAGDVWNWLQSRTGRAYTFVLDQRWPRVAAALLAGAALAVAGTTVQAVTRNPLAEPSLLGITGGAGVAAVALITWAPLAGVLAMTGAAGAGALLAFALVYGLARRGGLQSDRLVLIGVGLSEGCQALITLIIVVTDPWNSAKVLTWLSGSTYGRTPVQVLPVLIALAVFTPVAFAARRELDLLRIDEDTPRILGVRLDRARLMALLGSAVLASTAVSAIGVVGFVGLVAPHAARALVGGRHSRVIPVAALLGAVLVSLADTVGRTVIAPAQIPAGLITAMVGTPYFVFLLWRTRLRGAGQ